MKNAFRSILGKIFISAFTVIGLAIMLPEDVSASALTFVPMYNDHPAEGLAPIHLDVEDDQWQNQPCLWVWPRHVFTGWRRVGNDVFGEFRDAEQINYKVTFKVKNGSWNDGSKNDKETTLSRWEDEDLALTLEDDDIPLVGSKPDNGYSAGSWDTDPADYTAAGNHSIGANRTFTYTYSKLDPTPPAPITHTVTYKVVNGKWNDDTTGDKSEAVQDNGHLARIPTVGNKPSSGFRAGSWSPSTPTATTVITENKTFTYTYVQNDPTPPSPTPTPTPTPKPRPKDDDYEDSPAPAPLPVNPNAVIGMSFVGTPIGNFKIGPQVQGAAAQFAFRVNTPAGWKEAFSFNMTVNDKADYSLKKGILSFRIPSQYLKAGRKFAVLGIDKNGIVKLFADADLKADTITINLDIEGYAFDLIYFD